MAANPNRSANDQIADEFTTHTLNILRVAADLQKPVLAELERLEGTLSGEVAKLPANTSAIKAARLNALLAQTQASISDAYKKIGATTTAGLAKMAAVEQQKTMAVVNKGIGASVMTVASTPEQLQALASGILLTGRFPRQWWANQDALLSASFEAAMRDGIHRGEGIDKLVQRVRGTKAANYADGIMYVPKYQAEALVRTAVQTAANQARLLSFEANTDVIKAIQWRSTLDERTTPICINLDGKQWTLPGYDPIDHDIPFPGPIAHWQCRSTQVAVTKSWAELAAEAAVKPPDGPPTDIETLVRQEAKEDGKTDAEADAIVDEQKALVDGKATQPEDINEFLNRKTDTFQNALLGPHRAELFRQGKIEVKDLLDQKQRPLSVASLEAMVDAGHSVPVAKFKEGDGGLALSERAALDDSLMAGINEGKILSHFLDAVTGKKVSFEGTSPSPDDVAAAKAFDKAVYLRNGLTKGSVFTPQEYNLFASLPNFQGAKVVSPNGRVLSMAVKTGQTFTPADALLINQKMDALKNTSSLGQAEKMQAAVGSKLVKSVSFKDHGTGTVQPPPPPDAAAAKLAQKKAEALAAEQADVAAKAQAAADAAQADKLAAEKKVADAKALADKETARQERAQIIIDGADKQGDPLSLAIQDLLDQREYQDGYQPTELLAAAQQVVKEKAVAKKAAADAKALADKQAAEAAAAAQKLADEQEAAKKAAEAKLAQEKAEAAAKAQAIEDAAQKELIAAQSSPDKTLDNAATAVLKAHKPGTLKASELLEKAKQKVVDDAVKEQARQDKAKAEIDDHIAKGTPFLADALKTLPPEATHTETLAVAKLQAASDQAADDAKKQAAAEAAAYKAASKGVIAAFGPGSPATVAPINGIPFKPAATAEPWLAHVDTVLPDEPSLPKLPKKSGGGGFKEQSTGVIFVEDDGSLWLYSPTNNFGGYKNTLSKGRTEPGLTMQQNALKEAHEELGLTGTITGFLGDFERSETMTRFYVGKRTGGEPWTGHLNGETDYVKLATPDQAEKLFNRKYDKDVLAALRTYLNPPAAPPPSAPPASVAPHMRATQPVTAGFPPDPARLVKLSALGGTTGAYLAQDPTTKEKFVVKKGGTVGGDPAGHLREEVMTDALYRGLGIAVPDEHLYETPAGPVKVTRFLENSKSLDEYLRSAAPREQKAVLDKIRSNFAVDALLGNWDVLGQSMDNMRVAADGTPYRIDNGGGLRYRAQGKLKTADEWNAAPTDLWSLRSQAWAPKGVTVIPGNVSTFGKLSIVDIAKQVHGINQTAFEQAIDASGVPPEVKATLLERMRTMRVIADKADEMKQWNFLDSHTEDITREMVGLRKAGIVNLLPNKLIQDGNRPGETYSVRDENGKLWDDLRNGLSSTRASAPVAPAGPATIYPVQFDHILAAIKTINHHSKVGDAAYNQTKVDAALAQEKTLQQTVKAKGTPPEQKAAAQAYLDALDKMKQAVALGKAGNFAGAGAVIPAFDAIKEKPKAAGAPAPAPVPVPVAAKLKPGESIVSLTAAHVDANGGVSSLIGGWMNAQKSSSWSSMSQAYKWFLYKRMNLPDTEIYWDGDKTTPNDQARNRTIAEKHYKTAVGKFGSEEALAKSFTIWHALTQEVLGNTAFRYNDQGRKAVRIIRTEMTDVMSVYKLIEQKGGKTVRKYGKGLSMPRGLNESGSIFTDVYPVGSSEVTVQAIPHSRVTALYFTSRPGESGAGFLGDGENEFTFIPNGIPFDYTGKRGTIGITHDGGEDATGWNMDVAHVV